MQLYSLGITFDLMFEIGLIKFYFRVFYLFLCIPSPCVNDEIVYESCAGARCPCGSVPLNLNYF
jgi:hypothetical protein